MTNKPRSITLSKSAAVPQAINLDAPKVKQLEIDRYHEELAQDEAEKRGGWYDENKAYFSEKGKAE